MIKGYTKTIMTNKLFVFDIDGTLLPEGGMLPQESIDAIKLIHEHHDLAVLATGRAYVQTIEIAKQLGIKKYLICASGATITRLDNNETTIRSVIPKKIFDYFINLAQITKRQLNIKLVDRAIKYYFGDNAHQEINHNSDFWKKGGTLNPTYDDFKNIDQDVDLKKVIAISLKAEPEIINRYFDQVKNEIQLLDHDFSTMIVSNVYLEVYKKGINKSHAIKSIIEAEKINLEDVYVFGDSNNDIEMINDFHHGIAMGNATDDVKAVANEVISSCKDNGVYQYIKAFYKN